MTLNPHKVNFIQKTLEVAMDDLIVARYLNAATLRDNADVVAELLRDSIESFAIRTGLRTDRFADAYAIAHKMTLATLDKPHLRGICRFERLPVEAALRWIKSRLLNNLKTVLTNSKSSYWLGHTDWEMMAADAITFGSAEIEAELARLSPEQIVDGLRVMFFGGADIGELQYLSERFEIDLDTVIGRYDMPVVIERTLAGNPQLCMDLGVVCDEQ